MNVSLIFVFSGDFKFETELFHTKYLASLTNQNARFYSIMRFYPVPVWARMGGMLLVCSF